MAQVKVKHWPKDACWYRPLPKAAAVKFKMGMPASLESNTAVILNAVGEDGTFAGLVYEGDIEGTEATEIIVCCGPVVAQVAVSSATYGYGDGLLYVSGSYTADYTFADDSGANTICWSLEEKTSAVTSLEVLFNATLLQKLFSSAA